MPGRACDEASRNFAMRREGRPPILKY